MVRLFVLSGVDIDMTSTEVGGYTALHCAAAEGRVDILQLLLIAGAEKNVESQRGETALKLAIMRGHLEVVSTLLAAGVNASLADVDLAAANGRREMEDRLHEYLAAACSS